MKIALIIFGVLICIILLIFFALIISANRRRPKFNKKGFTSLEKILLSEFYELFDVEIQNKLKAQIDYFEPRRKWRQYWKKSMSVELFGDTKNPLSDSLKYNRRDDSKLATIRFTANNEKYYLEFNNYDGRLWGWKIRPNPKSIMTLTTLNITSKNINNDPTTFAQITFKKEKINPIPEFKGLLNELNTIQSIQQVYQPITSQLLKNYTKNIDSKLPIEYLNIIKESEGVDFINYNILGISEIYSTGLDDGNYYHLAEFKDGVIAIKEEDKSGMVYFCHYSGLLDILGTDFRSIILVKAKSITT